MFVVGIWASLWDAGSDITPVEDLVPDKLWAGERYMILEPFLEYTLASLSIAQDFLVTAMGCYVMRSIPKPAGGFILLIGMQSLTITVGLVRIVCFRLGVEKEFSSANGDIITDRRNLETAFIFLSDFEAIFSVIVSCLPGVRAWYRSTAWRRRKQVLSERTAGTLQVTDTSTHNVGFSADELENDGKKRAFLQVEEVAT